MVTFIVFMLIRLFSARYLCGCFCGFVCVGSLVVACSAGVTYCVTWFAVNDGCDMLLGCGVV